MASRDRTALRAPQARSPARRPGLRNRRLWLPLAFLAAIGKTHIIQLVFRHPHSLVPAAALCLAGAILRGRPTWIAAAVGLLLGGLEMTASFVLAVGVAFGAYVMLMTVFLAIATVLQARSPGWRP